MSLFVRLEHILCRVESYGYYDAIPLYREADCTAGANVKHIVYYVVLSRYRVFGAVYRHADYNVVNLELTLCRGALGYLDYLGQLDLGYLARLNVVLGVSLSNGYGDAENASVYAFLRGVKAVIKTVFGDLFRDVRGDCVAEVFYLGVNYLCVYYTDNLAAGVEESAARVTAVYSRVGTDYSDAHLGALVRCGHCDVFGIHTYNTRSYRRTSHFRVANRKYLIARTNKTAVCKFCRKQIA